MQLQLVAAATVLCESCVVKILLSMRSMYFDPNGS